MKEAQNELFEQYFNGALDTEDTQAFEERLRVDPVFKEEYQAYVQAVKLIRNTPIEAELRLDPAIAAIRASFKKSLQPSKEEERPGISTPEVEVKPGRVRYISLLRWSAAAAVFSGVLLLAWYFFTPATEQFAFDPALNPASANRKFSTEILEQRARGFGENAHRKLYEGLDNYNKNIPGAALQHLQNYLKDGVAVKKDTARYFLGEIYRELENYEQALKEWDQMSDAEKLYNRKYFSIALATLHLERQSEAKQAAQKVLDSSDTLFHERAAKLIKKLE